MRRALAAVAAVILFGGCSMIPRWVPFIGAKGEPKDDSLHTAAPPVKRDAETRSAPRAAGADEAIVDRVIAVVNNDAITLGELQETIVAYRQESREAMNVSDDELLKQFLPRLIDVRLQLQEADREKITVEDIEVEEELTERIKKYNAPNREAFEAAVKAQGLTMEAVRKRLREAVRVNKVIRRKVALRVSVTDGEIETYFLRNREKLETGLGYHARHILLVPEAGDTDASWEATRIKAEMLRTQILEGADFADLARQHSRDATAADGGDLGTLKRGELAEDIENQILALKQGEVSKPYRSPLGYHLFRLESKEALDDAGMNRVKQQIREILFREKYDARFDAWLKEIKERAIIEVRI
ncbi:MAG TPA: peptidylprolyl isomerase [Methylomirabilota bacterium]|jgi:peptidyl-prolyl cis-trans isomerase SurA